MSKQRRAGLFSGVARLWAACLLVLVGASGCGYNEVIERDETVKAAWAEVENQYQRRADVVPNLVRVVQASYSVALLGGEEKPIGFLTVNDRVTGKRYSFEDFALLKTFADQSSAAIRNRQLTNQLARAKEMETFQTLSTFFVHDLKNLANRFALAQQNIPLHFDKPAFREDLVRTMEKSVAKIENMTRRLSSLSRGSSANRVERVA